VENYFPFLKVIIHFVGLSDIYFCPVSFDFNVLVSVKRGNKALTGISDWCDALCTLFEWSV